LIAVPVQVFMVKKVVGVFVRFCYFPSAARPCLSSREAHRRVAPVQASRTGSFAEIEEIPVPACELPTHQL
jgi:hypothetical protein